MTKEELKEAAKVMEAYANGKTIQCNDNRLGNGEWVTTDNPSFNWDKYAYRIKPQPKYRPFKSQEECWSEMQEHTNFGWLRRNDTGACAHISAVFPYEIIFGSEKYSYKKAFECYTFVDGLPFGKREE